MKLTFLLLISSVVAIVTSTPLPSPDRFFKHYRSSLLAEPKQSIELTQPLPSDRLVPSYSHLVLNHSFAYTYGEPPTSVSYSPPESCPPPWNYVVLNLNVAVKGDQYDRIAGLWFGGVEVLRTSTAEGSDGGVFWSVRKDVSKYSSLFARSDLNFSMMLENLVNEGLPGVFDVNVTLEFFKVDQITPAPAPSLADGEVEFGDFESFENVDLKMVLDKAVDGFSSGNGGSLGLGFGSVDGEMPADLIIPVADDGQTGFWFRIEGEKESHFKNVRIPRNTRRAALEIYISFHGNDEFWYSNPPDSYIKTNNLPTGRGNGAFREVHVAIDGKVIGSVVPIPVIFTGGINPLFWEPIVAIGAFNLPTYEVDVTPFLGVLLDGESHNFSIGVTDGISFWLVDANLHLWLESDVYGVQAKSNPYQGPSKSIKRKSKFKKLDGSFDIKMKTESKSEGWVMTSTQGNLTTIFTREIKFKNSIEFKHNGTYKSVEQSITSKTELKIVNVVGVVVGQASLKRKYPLEVTTSTKDRGNGTYLLVTSVEHCLKENFSVGNISSSISNKQESDGWISVQDHNVLDGEANTKQNFVYIDNSGCYTREVAAVNGTLTRDNTTAICNVGSS